jgi:hypothetical protein
VPARPFSGADPWAERRRAWLDAATRVTVFDPRLAETIARAREATTRTR